MELYRIMEKYQDCRYCGGTTLDHCGNAAFVKCQNCGLVARNPFPSPEDLDRLYKTSWNEPDVNLAETGSVDEMLAVQYVQALEKSIGRSVKDLRLLDYGAGKGALMKALVAAGADTYGIEPYGYEQLVEQSLNCFKKLSDLPKDLSFDGIITMDVVEHLRRPWEVFSDLLPKLEAGGWLCVATPNPSGLNARLNKGRWREMSKPGHILFMDERTLEKMLREAGYVSIRSLNWKVEQHLGLVQKVSHKIMRFTGLFGASRIIAYKPK